MRHCCDYINPTCAIPYDYRTINQDGPKLPAVPDPADTLPPLPPGCWYEGHEPVTSAERVAIASSAARKANQIGRCEAPPAVNPFQAAAGTWEHRLKLCSQILSVQQPHAEDIASGSKPYEYRTWTTGYRGPLLIVAGLKFDNDAGAMPEDRNRLPRGVAICIVDLVAIEPMHGQFGWRVTNPVRVTGHNLRPVSVKGRLGLFPMTDELRKLLRPA